MSKTLKSKKQKKILIPNNTNCNLIKINKFIECPYGQR